MFGPDFLDQIKLPHSPNSPTDLLVKLLFGGSKFIPLACKLKIEGKLRLNLQGEKTAPSSQIWEQVARYNTNKEHFHVHFHNQSVENLFCDVQSLFIA